MRGRGGQTLADESPVLAARWDRFVACNDVPCPGCGYNLRGLEGRLCPECGGRIDPAALMFAGTDDLTFSAIVRHTGVVGALALAGAAHLVAVLVAPTFYAHFVIASAARSGVGSLDLILTAALVLVAAFAWIHQRAAGGGGWWRGVLGAGSDDALQRIAAGMCWIIAAAKAGLIVMILALGLLF